MEKVDMALNSWNAIRANPVSSGDKVAANFDANATTRINDFVSVTFGQHEFLSTFQWGDHPPSIPSEVYTRISHEAASLAVSSVYKEMSSTFSVDENGTPALSVDTGPDSGTLNFDLVAALKSMPCISPTDAQKIIGFFRAAARILEEHYKDFDSHVNAPVWNDLRSEEAFSADVDVLRKALKK
ncbi:hypothetical protein D2T29_12475 [Sinirhodobacter populi]|uniref:Uncharacterized protein n=1 Tax=Paenirhodobacter populi TaxID=2306993 RepID=A0A443KCJ7_9RHOB|nr:hypothetical protein [Sinirhodobacter populi]RWR30480.1 hypothetical protein D2T29_12475 [Sinirhodobacter populi]